MHPLLCRQLARVGADAATPPAAAAWAELCAAVSATYAEADQGPRRRAGGDLDDSLAVTRGKMAAIGTLVAGLSHELNNPLAVILGHAQGLLRRAPAGAPEREALDAIERHTLRCAHLVRALLDFARFRSAVRRPVSAEDLFARVEELARGQARRRAVTLTSAPPREPLEVQACREEIECALLHLVTNALDATPPGGEVALRARAAERVGVRGIELLVADTGTGIADEVLADIFEPFFTTKPAGEGAGLGLALARQIVESHQGRIEVDTRPGRGTTMRLWLPLAPAREARP